MFHSRDKRYRDPTGAVPDGREIHFRITLPRELSCSEACLVIEQEKGETFCQGMFWCGMNGEDKEWWECHFTPDKPGLYFYHFECLTLRGRLRLSRGFGGAGIFGGTDRWQLTVFRKDLRTPDWLSGGVMYQIFPDRFFSSKTQKQGVPSDREFHQSWEEQPKWRPDAQGRVTNLDFFGGDLRGIEEKLSYLQELGVTCIYCNPIFEAHSNHRYDTADYSKIDPLLGSEEDFISLCRKALEFGIRIVIDGVFSHTGSDSVYFNKQNRYAGPGAYQSKESPYFSWYTFSHWPQSYECWWNFDTLPNVRELEPEYDKYINGENGIVRKWLRLGASGWRLDVADELPDEFIDHLAQAAKEEFPDALVLGEVWEDASNKTAYGVRRRYLLGGQLDTVMNYPFRDAVLGFLLGESPLQFFETVEGILENYPPPCIRLLMNHIGTHDTERAITILAGEPAGQNGREWQSAHSLSPQQRALGVKRMKLASLLQFTLPGVPCIYYGDEAGAQGYKDPFNRTAFPWGREDQELLSWYRTLGALRREYRSILAEGEFLPLAAEEDLLLYLRQSVLNGKRESLLVAVNRGSSPRRLPEFPFPLQKGKLLLGSLPSPERELAPLGFLLAAFSEPDDKEGPVS